MLRHAPVKSAYIYGQQDVPADLKQSQAFRWLVDQLPSDPAVISSDLKRCVETAERLGFEKYETSPSIREQHFGSWQGLTYEQARIADPVFYDQFWQKPELSRPPNGESFKDVSERSTAFLTDLLAQERAEDDVLLVTHAGVIRAIIAHFLEIPLARALSLAVEPLSLTRFTIYQNNDSLSAQADWINRAPVLV